MTTTQPQDVPVAVYAQTSQAGRPYVEAQVTGTAAINLATAIARRLQDNHLARSISHPGLVALIAGAITDHPVELTVEQADALADQLHVATDVAWSVGQTVTKVEALRPRDTQPLAGYRKGWSA